MTTNRNDPGADRRKADERKAKAEAARREGAEHRLRGTEQDADFSDAEGDSCVVARKRDEKQSES